MKRLILILIIVPLHFYAQNTGCSFVPYPEMFNTSNYTNRFQTITDPNEPMVFNIKFQGMHETDRSDTHGINEERFLQIIAKLNTSYNQFNIFFKYRGYSIVNDSDYVNIGGPGQHLIAEMVQNVHTLGYYDDTAINIFVNHGASSGGINDVYYSTTFNDDEFYNYLVPHEMGHTLGLLHIQSESITDRSPLILNLPSCMYNPNNPFAPRMIKPTMPSQQPFIQIENVTRNHYYSDGITVNPNYNADIAGDMVADTQACFDGFIFNYCKNILNQPYPNICDWTVWSEHPDVTDFVGETYKCTTVESHNVMGGNTDLILTFTPGQGRKMREHIIADPYNVLQQRLNLTEDGSADVSVLYQPFSVSGGSGSGNSTTAYSKTYSTNTSSTGANVWNCGPFTMRFQTGFDCEFYSNNGTVIQTPYQQYNVATGTQIGVRIPILGQQIYNNVAPVCFYSFEPFTSGDIKSLESLGSTYYSQEELDKIKASDPKLYEQLQSGKYHIITKVTDSGFVDQKVIYKN